MTLPLTKSGWLQSWCLLWLDLLALRHWCPRGFHAHVRIQSPNVFHILSLLPRSLAKGNHKNKHRDQLPDLTPTFPKKQLLVRKKHPRLEMNPLKLHQLYVPSPAQSQVLCFSVLVRSPRSPFLCFSFEVPPLACLCLLFCQCYFWPERKRFYLQLIPLE